MSIWLVDPISKAPSIPLTAFVSGFAVATFKLLVDGMVIGTLQMGAFTGVDFAAVVGALGALYWAHGSVPAPQPPAPPAA